MRFQLRLSHIVAAVAAAGACSATFAQEVGTYVGTTASGLNVHFVVERNASTGTLFVAQTYWETPARCPHPLKNIQYLSYMMLTQHKIDKFSDLVIEDKRENRYQSVTLRFHGNRVRGFAIGASPYLTDESFLIGQSCFSGRVAFEATRVSTERLTPQPSSALRAQSSAGSQP
jgi:hypothetical protein